MMSSTNGPEQGRLLVGIALTGTRKAKNIVKWALEKFLPEGNVTFKIIHVYPKIHVAPTGPTPMGTWLPVVRDPAEIERRFREDIESKMQKKLLPYLHTILEAKQTTADVVLLESDDVAMAISLEVAKQSIRHLVIGGPSLGGIFSMKSISPPTGNELGQIIAKSAPGFCSVYIIIDGKLQQLRQADSEQNVITMEDDTSNLSNSSTDSSSGSSSLTIGHLLKSKPSTPQQGSSANTSNSTSPSTSQRKQPESHSRHASIHKSLTREAVELKNYEFQDSNTSGWSQSSGNADSGSWISDRTTPTGSFTGTHSMGTTPPSSFPSTTPTGSNVGIPPTHFMSNTPHGGSYIATTPPAASHSATPGGSYVGTPPMALYERTPRSVTFQGISSGSDAGESSSQITEIEKLRIELQHIAKMYELTQNNSIGEREETKLKEEKDREKARMEKIKSQREANAREKPEKNKTENMSDSQAAKEAEESKNKLKALFASPAVQYQKFTWEEIIEATSSLSEEFKIGMGAFGTVYKCKLHHTTVAVKVLHSKNSVTNKQFVQELEILSTIRHPHLLLLLGAVPEESCLIYEYMDNGSLDDRLFQKSDKPPLPWYDRFRICYEVAGALAFLHSTTPRPIIHRDLKPANILLDHNLVSKIGDAGLGTMINVEPNNAPFKTIYKETSPVGTLCYIDPEYQRTGRVSTKSDIYALGVVILQLLAGKPAVGIAYLVEDAMDEGNLGEILDPLAGAWPKEETFELAVLGMQCVELRGRDRPDLQEKILPVLERLKEMADNTRESASSAQAATPPHYFCPILKEVMEDPYVAADGYTYERSAIEQWLIENDTSPITDELIPHKFIMPNTTLLEAIKQWKSKK